jgi:hypothetical protein
VRPRLLRISRLAAKIRTRTGRTRHVRAAVRQAREFCRSRPAEVRVCWDLDNTLVDTGALLRAGMTLDRAIIEAYPVPNMLAFYEAMHERLVHAEHFILSARSTTMREETFAWLRRHGMTAPSTSVCLIPTAAAKPRVWRQLSEDAALVIVDDLAFNHEADETSLYDDLISQARDAAVSYIGASDIAAVAADETAAASILARTVRDLEGGAPSRTIRSVPGWL